MIIKGDMYMNFWVMLLILQLFEGYNVNPLQLNASAEDVGYGRQQAHQPHGDGFFHPLELEPTLQMGYVHVYIC